MPGLDGTGPRGMGSMTGGGFGLCNPYGRSYAGWGFGRGRGFRRGFGPGFGWGRGFGRRGFAAARGGWYGPAYGSPYAMGPEDELGMLKEEADAMRSELEGINRRIQELESQSAES